MEKGLSFVIAIGIYAVIKLPRNSKAQELLSEFRQG